jgi:YfiH family protein
MPLSVTMRPGEDNPDSRPMLLPFSKLELAGATAFVTTRHGGVSLRPFASLNLGDHVGDRREDVLANRRILAEALGISPASLVFVDQVHGAHVLRVHDSASSSSASSSDDMKPCADAMITDEPGLCLCIMVADCVPILLYDPRKRAIGAAHAGWRGTVADIAGRTVRAMEEAFGSEPFDMLAAIGPSIGPEDFEVGPEVCKAFQGAYPDHWPELIRAGEGDRSRIDLWRANALQLETAGIASERIEIAGISTLSQSDDFFSYRAEGGRTGRFTAGIFVPDSKMEQAAQRLR